MHHDHIDKILQSYLDGSCTDQEREWVDLWLLKRGYSEKINIPEQQEEKVKKVLLTHVEEMLKGKELPHEWDRYTVAIRRLTRDKRYVLPMLAAMVLIIFSGILFLTDRTEPQGEFFGQEIVGEAMPTDLLITAFGEDYPIDSLPIGVEQQIGGVFVQRTSDDVLKYRLLTEYAKTSDIPTSHTISVPAGRELHIDLPDGSHLWLNTGSVLRFDPMFAAAGRKLYLAGEAFFEVASDKQHPFVVLGADFQVKATGTQFHIYAYNDDPIQTATLVEGKVEVSSEEQIRQLLPSQQWEIKSGGQPKVTTVNVAPILGKKEGYFVFDNQNIHQIMTDVARWYNIEVHLEGKIEEKVLGGTFSKKRSLDELLDYLTTLVGCHFKKEGRRVIIMQ